MKKYELILCDPPWSYNNKVSNGAADNHYNTTDLYSLSRLPMENARRQIAKECLIELRSHGIPNDKLTAQILDK